MATDRLGINRFASVLATWFGAGTLRPAPGTWGSLAAALLAWPILAWLGHWWLLAAALAVFALGVWASRLHAERLGQSDPGSIVIDEVAGQWIALLLACPAWHHLLIGFVAFRLFDIVKPWPVSWADRRLKGGFGIMADDVLAGLYAAACVAGWRLIEGWSAACPI